MDKDATFNQARDLVSPLQVWAPFLFIFQGKFYFFQVGPSSPPTTLAELTFSMCSFVLHNFSPVPPLITKNELSYEPFTSLANTVRAHPEALAGALEHWKQRRRGDGRGPEQSPAFLMYRRKGKPYPASRCCDKADPWPMPIFPFETKFLSNSLLWNIHLTF